MWRLKWFVWWDTTATVCRSKNAQWAPLPHDCRVTVCLRPTVRVLSLSTRRVLWGQNNCQSLHTCAHKTVLARTAAPAEPGPTLRAAQTLPCRLPPDFSAALMARRPAPAPSPPDHVGTELRDM